MYFYNNLFTLIWTNLGGSKEMILLLKQSWYILQNKLTPKKGYNEQLDPVALWVRCTC